MSSLSYSPPTPKLASIPKAAPMFSIKKVSWSDMSRDHFLKGSPEARTEVLEENIVELQSSQYGFTASMLKLSQTTKILTVLVTKECEIQWFKKNFEYPIVNTLVN